MFDVIGIGTTSVDYFFEADNKFLKKYNLHSEYDFLFEEVTATPNDIIKELPLLNKCNGGICTNTLSVLSHLGIKTSYYGVIGKDEEGNFWLNNSKKINKSKIVRDGNMSICMCILTHKRKKRLFISELNLKEGVIFKNMDFNYINRAKIIHVGPFISNLKENINNTYKLFKGVDGPILSFTPSVTYSKLGLRTILPLIEETDILFSNKSEIKLLTGKSEKEGSEYLIKIGPKIIICTIGEKGALITTKNNQFISPALKIKTIVDTTGAGDTFAAGFLYGVLKGKSPKWSADFANKLAAISVTDFGLHWLKKLDKKTVDKLLSG